MLKEDNQKMMRIDRPANGLTPLTNPKSAKKIAAIGPVPHAAELSFLLRERGWDVVSGMTGRDTRKIAIKAGASLVVLPARGEPETGWLSCLKLVRQGRKRRVVLIGELGDLEAERFAQFAGAAAYLTVEDGIDAIWDAGTAPRMNAILSK